MPSQVRLLRRRSRQEPLLRRHRLPFTWALLLATTRRVPPLARRKSRRASAQRTSPGRSADSRATPCWAARVSSSTWPGPIGRCLQAAHIMCRWAERPSKRACRSGSFWEQNLLGLRRRRRMSVWCGVCAIVSMRGCGFWGGVSTTRRTGLVGGRTMRLLGKRNGSVGQSAALTWTGRTHLSALGWSYAKHRPMWGC